MITFTVSNKIIMSKQIIYTITSLGAISLNLPENSKFRASDKVYVNPKFWVKSILFDIVEEKIDRLDSHKIIVRNTRWITEEAKTPIINTIHGPYLNQGCHILPSYSFQFLKSKIKNHE